MSVIPRAGSGPDIEREPRRSEATATSSKGGVTHRERQSARRCTPLTRRGDARDATFAVLDRIEGSAEEPGVRELVDRARRSDDLAFAELYIRFFERVHRYLLIALKNPDDALEAAQQVFLKLLVALPGHEPLREPFRAWLFRVVRNHAIDQQRHASHDDADEDTGERDAALLARTSAMVASDGGGGIKALIAELPTAQQRVLVLRFVYEFTAPETAEALGTTADAVRHTQQRALKTLARLHPGLRPSG